MIKPSELPLAGISARAVFLFHQHCCPFQSHFNAFPIFQNIGSKRVPYRANKSKALRSLVFAYREVTFEQIFFKTLTSSTSRAIFYYQKRNKNTGIKGGIYGCKV
jgi:hypothetical protein